jgi:VWFA-related protein
VIRPTSILSFLALVSILAPAAPTAGQEPPAPPPAEQQPPATTFFETVDVEVATVEVFVSDRQGTPVTGLSEDDFELRIDGEPVEITNFYAEVLGRPATADWQVEAAAVETETETETETDSGPGLIPPPQRLRIVVFIDHTNIRAVNRKRALERLEEFLERNAGPDDSVAVVSLTDRLHVHSDFLNDQKTIDRIFDEVGKVSFADMSGETERRRIFSQIARGHTGGGQSIGRQNPATGLSNAAFFGPEIEASIRAYAAAEYQRTRGSLDALKRFLGSLGGVPGRKALIFVSDGIVNRPGEDLFIAYRNAYGSSSLNPGVPKIDPNIDYSRQVGNFDVLREVQQVAEAANAAGVTFYALDAQGDHAIAVRSAASEGWAETSEVISTFEANVREPLEYTSEATGGRRIEASDKLLSDLAIVAADFDSYYSLGFRPPEAEQGKMQDIKVRLLGDAAKGRTVRYRESRRTKGTDQRTGEAMLAAIFYNATANPLELGLTHGEPVRREDGNMVLPVTIEIPVARIALIPEEAVSAGRLSIYVTVKDKSGDAREVQRLPFHLQIPSDKVEEAKQHAAHHTLQVVLRPGDQQIAVGVRDEIASTLSTIRIEVAGSV